MGGRFCGGVDWHWSEQMKSQARSDFVMGRALRPFATPLTAGSYRKPGHNLVKEWGEPFKPLSRLSQQAVQSNMVYQPREVFLVSSSFAARLINVDRYAP